MRPGPAKNFDPDLALEQARDLFWQRGYDGTGIREIESALGIGRKSLYDTFGSKRELFLRALEQYTETVIRRICRGLEDPRSDAIGNLERVLYRLQEHHASSDKLGCMLGVAMAQADPDDEELAERLRAYLAGLEQAFERTIRTGQEEGTIDADARPKDVARNLVALTQGMALMGRIHASTAPSRAIVRSALHALRP